MTEHNWVIYSGDAEDGEVIACSTCGQFEDDPHDPDCKGPQE